jgi:osmotically inducible protein OsmC
MAVRTAKAEWKGNLRDGTGTVESETGAVSGRYSFSSRFEEGTGTNPEELVAAAHAGCFSMAFSANLAKAGHTPEYVRTTAHVHLEKGDAGFSIVRIDLVSRANVPGITEEAFLAEAEGAKQGCPISRALSGSIEVTLDAALES